MNKYQNIAKNTFYVMLGTIGSKLIYVLMLPIYTCWLSTDEFGASDTITVYTDILTTILFLNIADSIFVFPKMAKTDLEKKQYFSSGMAFMTLMTLIGGLLFLMADLFKDNFPVENVFFKYKWLIFFLLISRYLQVYIQEFTRSLDYLGIYSMTGVVLTGSVALYSFALIPVAGVYGYVYAIIAAHLSAAVYSFIAAHVMKYLSFRAMNRQQMKELLYYSVPLAPNSLMWWLINGINRPLMERQLGLAAIGIYAVSSRISGVINSISGIFGLAWGNSVLEEYGKEGFDRFFNNYLRFLTTLYFVGCYFLIIFSQTLVAIFASPEYYEASDYIPLLTLGLCFSCMASSIGAVFSAVKKSKYFFYASLWGGMVSVVALLILMPILGLFGVAISLALSFLAIMLVRWFYASRYVDIKNIPFYIFLVAMFFVVYLSDIYIVSYYKYVIVTVVIGLILYLIRHDIKKMAEQIINKKHK